MLTSVNNKYKLPGWEQNSRCVYIGRPGPWGNPYVIGRDGDRAEVIRKFRKDFNLAILFPEGQWGFKSVERLRGKILICFCFPQECHGDVIADYLNTGKIKPV